MRRLFYLSAFFCCFLILSISLIPSIQSSIVEDEIESINKNWIYDKIQSLNHFIKNSLDNNLIYFVSIIFIMYFIVMFTIGFYYGIHIGWNISSDSILIVRILYVLFFSLYIGITLPFVGINSFILEPIIAFIKHILDKPLILAEN